MENIKRYEEKKDLSGNYNPNSEEAPREPIAISQPMQKVEAPKSPTITGGEQVKEGGSGRVQPPQPLKKEPEQQSKETPSYKPSAETQSLLDRAMVKHSDVDYRVEEVAQSEKTKEAAEQQSKAEAEVMPYQPLTWESIKAQWEQEEKSLKEAQEAERKKDERAHRRRALIAALGDGISSLANLYYTTKGAPDMTPKTTMSAKQQERRDAMRKEREAKREAALKQARDDFWAGKTMEYNDAKSMREYALKEREQKRKERQAALDAAKKDAEILLLTNRAEEAEYRAMIKELEAGNMKEYLRLKNNLLVAQANRANRANSGGRSGSGSRGNKDYTTETEKEVIRTNPITGQQEKYIVKSTTNKAYGNKGGKKGWSAKK